MKKLLVFVVVFNTATVFASDCRIVETADKVEVVCVGNSVPAAKEGKQDQPVLSSRSARIKFLYDEINRLSSEGESVMKLNGKESIDEVKSKRALAGDKYRQMELYYSEIRSIKNQGDIELQELKDKIADDNMKYEEEYKRQTGKSYR